MRLFEGCDGRPKQARSGIEDDLVDALGRWRCADVDCDARSWIEQCLDSDAQAGLTRRAGAEACRR